MGLDRRDRVVQLFAISDSWARATSVAESVPGSTDLASRVLAFYSSLLIYFAVSDDPKALDRVKNAWTNCFSPLESAYSAALNEMFKGKLFGPTKQRTRIEAIRAFAFSKTDDANWKILATDKPRQFYAVARLLLADARGGASGGRPSVDDLKQDELFFVQRLRKSRNTVAHHEDDDFRKRVALKGPDWESVIREVNAEIVGVLDLLRRVNEVRQLVRDKRLKPRARAGDRR